MAEFRCHFIRADAEEAGDQAWPEGYPRVEPTEGGGYGIKTGPETWVAKDLALAERAA
jgi:hypothetical protein